MTSGELEDRILEANVRGYQQRTAVNRLIQETLLSDKGINFWLLNNGITIIASKAQNAGHLRLTLEDPQIVNGLQTSREVFNYFSDAGPKKDDRTILVKVIETPDAAVQDAVVRATNSQNPLPKASLRAHEPIHLKIEDLFRQYDLFYDRRKGFYKDKGKPISKIVSITELLQAIVSIILQRPNDARGRPSDYISIDEKYEQVFTEDKYPLSVYLICVLLMRRVTEFINSLDRERNEKLDIKFYVATLLACHLTQEARPSPDKLLRVNIGEIDESLLNDSYQQVWRMYEELGRSSSVARGPNLTKKLDIYISENFLVSPQSQLKFDS